MQCNDRTLKVHGFCMAAQITGMRVSDGIIVYKTVLIVIEGPSDPA